MHDEDGVIGWSTRDAYGRRRFGYETGRIMFWRKRKGVAEEFEWLSWNDAARRTEECIVLFPLSVTSRGCAAQTMGDDEIN